MMIHERGHVSQSVREVYQHNGDKYRVRGEKKRGALQNVSVDRWKEIVCLFFSFPRVTFVLLPPSGKSIPSQIYYT